MTNGNIAMAREILDDEVQEAARALDEMKLPALRAKYREVFKEDTVSHNGPWLRKRMKYRLQEIAFGGLSERAQARIRELAVDAPVRRRGFPPATKSFGPWTHQRSAPVARISYGGTTSMRIRVRTCPNSKSRSPTS